MSELCSSLHNARVKTAETRGARSAPSTEVIISPTAYPLLACYCQDYNDIRTACSRTTSEDRQLDRRKGVHAFTRLVHAKTCCERTT